MARFTWAATPAMSTPVNVTSIPKSGALRTS